MLRKTMLALGASIALGAAALAPTSASAGGGGHGGWGHGPHFGFYGGYDGCIRERWVPTPYGLVLRPVNVCY